MVTFIIATLIAFTVYNHLRLKSLEKKYNRIVKEYKELSHHALIANRDGFRKSTNTYWNRVECEGRKEGPFIPKS